MTIKECPHCGKIDTVRCTEAARAGAGKDYKDHFVVVCSVARGGCGCSSNYALTRNEAWASWNRRVRPNGRRQESIYLDGDMLDRVLQAGIEEVCGINAEGRTICCFAEECEDWKMPLESLFVTLGDEDPS